MKASKILLYILIACFSSALHAQEDSDTSYWSQGGKAGLTFSQVGLSNWAGGGEPSVSFSAIINFNLKYEKNPHLWQTVFDAGYGAQRLGQSSEEFKKTDDNIVLISRYGYKIASKWYVSAMASLRTQFYDGYNYDNDTTTYVSNFMAPGYGKIGIGISYNHSFSKNESFTFTFAPVNLKSTIVLDDDLSSRGMYGVEPGKNVRTRGGMDIYVAIRKELIKNISLSSNLTLFTPYNDLAILDVNWDMAIWFKVNEWFSANINTQMIYDQDVAFKNDAGQSYNSAIQFKEVLGIGLAFSF